MREHAAALTPGSYLLSANRAVLTMSFDELSATVGSLVRDVGAGR